MYLRNGHFIGTTSEAKVHIDLLPIDLSPIAMDLPGDDLPGDDFAGDATTSGVLKIDGTEITGQLEVEDDEDWFAIELTAGELVRITSDGSFETNLTLVDEFGSIVAFGNLDFNTLEAFVLADVDESGTYYVNVSGFITPFDYTLSANVVEDDFAGNSSTTGVLEIDGTEVTGAIEFSGDEDWFAIELTAGETVRIASEGFDADITLRDASGNFLAFDLRDFDTNQVCCR